MGFDTDLFCAPPDEHLLCVICHGVFEEPCSLLCGHIFCKCCLKKALRNTKQCPCCRKACASDKGHPLVAVKGLIENLQVTCRNTCSNEESSGELASIESTSEIECFWVGKLACWKAHNETECPCTIIECAVPGCGFTCQRQSMASHLSREIAKHTSLIVAEQVSQLGAKLEAKSQAKFQAKVDELELRFKIDQRLAELEEGFDEKIDQVEEDFDERYVREMTNILAAQTSLKDTIKENRIALEKQFAANFAEVKKKLDGALAEKENAVKKTARLEKKFEEKVAELEKKFEAKTSELEKKLEATLAERENARQHDTAVTKPQSTPQEEKGDEGKGESLERSCSCSSWDSSQ